MPPNTKPEAESQVDQFFAGLPQEDAQRQDIFAEVPAGDAPAPTPEKAEEPEAREPRKNREHRRLEAKLQAERESNIALAERIKVLAELKKDEPAKVGDMPAEWVALYGNTDESKSAWKIQERLFSTYKEQAKSEALAEFESQQRRALEAQRESEASIDEALEALEDAHDVDLTSDAPAARKARREFLEVVSKLSPRDADGNITAYADFGASWGLYSQTRAQKQADPSTARAKEIAAQTMQRSAPSDARPPAYEERLEWDSWKRAL